MDDVVEGNPDDPSTKGEIKRAALVTAATGGKTCNPHHVLHIVRNEGVGIQHGCNQGIVDGPWKLAPRHGAVDESRQTQRVSTCLAVEEDLIIIGPGQLESLEVDVVPILAVEVQRGRDDGEFHQLARELPAVKSAEDERAVSFVPRAYVQTECRAGDEAARHQVIKEKAVRLGTRAFGPRTQTQYTSHEPLAVQGQAKLLFGNSRRYGGSWVSNVLFGTAHSASCMILLTSKTNRVRHVDKVNIASLLCVYCLLTTDIHKAVGHGKPGESLADGWIPGRTAHCIGPDLRRASVDLEGNLLIGTTETDVDSVQCAAIAGKDPG